MLFFEHLLLCSNISVQKCSKKRTFPYRKVRTVKTLCFKCCNFHNFKFSKQTNKKCSKKIDICGPCNSLPPSVGNEFWRPVALAFPYPHRWAHERFPVTSTRKPGRRSLISRLPLRCALWRGIIYKLSTYPSSCRAEPALHFSGSRCHLIISLWSLYTKA